MELLKDHETAFVYVIEESSINFMRKMAKRFRDFDLLEESLGISSKFISIETFS